VTDITLFPPQCPHLACGPR